MRHYNKMLLQQPAIGLIVINFDNLLTPDYSVYRLYISNLALQESDSFLWMRFGENGIYPNENDAYSYANEYYSPTDTDRQYLPAVSDNQIVLTGSEMWANSSSSNFMDITIGRNDAGFMSAKYSGMIETSNGNMDYMTGGGSSQINNLNSLQILASEGTSGTVPTPITGIFSLFGVC